MCSKRKKDMEAQAPKARPKISGGGVIKRRNPLKGSSGLFLRHGQERLSQGGGGWDDQGGDQEKKKGGKELDRKKKKGKPRWPPCAKTGGREEEGLNDQLRKEQGNGSRANGVIKGGAGIQVQGDEKVRRKEKERRKTKAPPQIGKTTTRVFSVREGSGLQKSSS